MSRFKLQVISVAGSEQLNVEKQLTAVLNTIASIVQRQREESQEELPPMHTSDTNHIGCQQQEEAGASRSCPVDLATEKFGNGTGR